MAGKVESFLKSELDKKNALLFVLIDSEVSNLEASSKLAQDVEKIGASAILVGGSSATDQIEMSQVVKGIKQNIQIPINVTKQDIINNYLKTMDDDLNTFIAFNLRYVNNKITAKEAREYLNDLLLSYT